MSPFYLFRRSTSLWLATILLLFSNLLHAEFNYDYIELGVHRFSLDAVMATTPTRSAIVTISGYGVTANGQLSLNRHFAVTAGAMREQGDTEQSGTTLTATNSRFDLGLLSHRAVGQQVDIWLGAGYIGHQIELSLQQSISSREQSNLLHGYEANTGLRFLLTPKIELQLTYVYSHIDNKSNNDITTAILFSPNSKFSLGISGLNQDGYSSFGIYLRRRY